MIKNLVIDFSSILNSFWLQFVNIGVWPTVPEEKLKVKSQLIKKKLLLKLLWSEQFDRLIKSYTLQNPERLS